MTTASSKAAKANKNGKTALGLIESGTATCLPSTRRNPFRSVHLPYIQDLVGDCSPASGRNSIWPLTCTCQDCAFDTDQGKLDRPALGEVFQMRPGNLAILCALLSLCSSCTDIKSEKSDRPKPRKKIVSRILTNRELSDDELRLLNGYIVRQSLSNPFQGDKLSIPTGRTIREMVEDQRNWMAQNTQQENEEKRAESRIGGRNGHTRERGLREYVTVTLDGFEQSDPNYINGFEARIAFKAGRRDLRAFRGKLALLDALGNSLGEIPVRELTSLKANYSGTTNYRSLYASFSGTTMEAFARHQNRVETYGDNIRRYSPELLVLIAGD